MISRKKNKHKKIFIIRLVVTCVFLLVLIPALFFAPIFTVEIQENMALNERISVIVDKAQTEAPEIYGELEVPETIDISPWDMAKALFQLNRMIPIIQKIDTHSLDTDHSVNSILQENIRQGNVQELIKSLAVFSGFVEDDILDICLTVGMILYGMIHILVTVFVIGNLVYLPIRFLIDRFLFSKPSARFEAFIQRFVGNLLLVLKYSVMAFFFLIVFSSVGIGEGVFLALAVYCAVVLFNAVMIQIDGTSEALNIVQGISLVSLLLYGGFFALYIDSGYARIVGTVCLNLIKKIYDSFVKMIDGDAYNTSVILWFAVIVLFVIFFATIFVFLRNFFKHTACLGGMCVGFREAKKDVIPNVLKRSVKCFFVIILVPLFVWLFNTNRNSLESSVMKELNSYSFLFSGAVFLVYLFSEFLFLKLIRMVDTAAFFYEDNMEGNKLISPKLSFLYFMEREDDCRTTISNDIIDDETGDTIIDGSVPSYVPDEWLENDVSQNSNDKT